MITALCLTPNSALKVFSVLEKMLRPHECLKERKKCPLFDQVEEKILFVAF